MKKILVSVYSERDLEKLQIFIFFNKKDVRVLKVSIKCLFYVFECQESVISKINEINFDERVEVKEVDEKEIATLG